MSATLPPLVLFLGPEVGEKDREVDALRQGMLRRHGDGLEQFTYYAFETTAGEVVQVLESGSLFGTGTLVRYRQVESLTRKDEVQPLIQYAKRPRQDALLVLESDGISVHKSLESAVGGRNRRIFWEMFEDQKIGWLGGYFRRHQVEISEEAVELILELTENTTVQLRQEADHLIAAVGSRITVQDVEHHLYHSREETVFSLFDAIVDRSLERALEILGTLSATEDAVRIASGLSWQFDRLHACADLRASGVSDGQLFARLAEQWGIQVRGKRAQGRLRAVLPSWSVAACRRIRMLLLELDEALRSRPAHLHEALLVLTVYSIIVRDGAWRGIAGPDRAPWHFASPVLRNRA